jgi:ComEC/Rec2-related protein
MRMDDQVETGALAALGARIRHGFRGRVTTGLADDSQEAQVIRAVVIGEQPPDEENLIAAFRNSGTLHVFSVSGLHVAMVGSIGWLILSWAGMPRRWAVVVLVPLIFGYSWITANSAPAVRSAWMGAVFLGAFAFRRRPDLLNALGAVLLAAMLWDGRLLFQPGVQLSYGVVAAIAAGTSWAAKAFAWMARPELYLPMQLMSRWQKFRLGLRQKTASSLAVSLAAGVGSAPLTAFHFGLVTPVSVLAGLVLVPLVFVLLSIALLSAALFSMAPPLARGLNRLNGLVADACVLSARGFSAIPGGHFTVGGEKRPMLLVYDPEYGDGGACFSDGRNSAVLLDCGGRQSFKHLVAPSLRRLGIAPDSVVLSHPDGGHLGGGSAVWEAFPIRQALLPVKRSRSPSFRAWIEQGPENGIRIQQAAAGGTLALPDGATLEILHVPDPHALHSLADERVAVFRLHWRGWKLLLTGDAGMGAELRMLDALTDVSADVIIAGRNRTDLSLCDRFLDAVKPRAIIASNAAYPEGEAVPPAAMDYWKSRGIRVIDQAAAGGVTLRVDDAGNLRIEGFLGPAPLILPPR